MEYGLIMDGRGANHDAAAFFGSLNEAHDKIKRTIEKRGCVVYLVRTAEMEG